MTKYGQGWQNYTPNRRYLVSTTNVIFSGWETMVFLISENGDIDYSLDLDCQRYSNENDAFLGHLMTYDKWQEMHIVKFK